MDANDGRFLWQDGRWVCVKKDENPVDLLSMIGPADIDQIIGRARVLYDYEARRSDELSISYGEELDILKKERNSWWVVQRLCILKDRVLVETGLIPSNYVIEIPKRRPPPPPTADGNAAPSASADAASRATEGSTPVAEEPRTTPASALSASIASVSSAHLSNNKRIEAEIAELSQWESLRERYQTALGPILSEYRTIFQSIATTYLQKLRTALPQSPLLDHGVLVMHEYGKLQDFEQKYVFSPPFYSDSSFSLSSGEFFLLSFFW
jgi:hypothetical protein